MNISNFEYLFTMILSGLFPILIALFHPFSPLKGKFKPAIIAIVLSAIPFIIWDVFATHRGHWDFNKDYLIGINIINLPLEEYLFFLVIPFNSIFIWLLLKKHKTLSNTFSQFLKPFIKHD